MYWYPCIEDKDFLHSYGIATTHDSRYVMRIKNIFEYDCDIILSFG